VDDLRGTGSSVIRLTKAQARKKTTAVPVEPADVGDTGEPAEVEGTAGEWRVDPAALGDGFGGRTALLSPFDRLVHDRVRAQELFDFEYTLEMYKPAESAAEATSRSRYSTKTDWWARSTSSPTARQACCA